MINAHAVSNTNASHRKFFPTELHTPRFTALSPQGARVLELLTRDGRVTRMTALHYGIPNITARIAELREEGFPVECEVKVDGNGRKYGSWFLEGNKAPPKRLVVGCRIVMNHLASRYTITTPGKRGVLVYDGSPKCGVRVDGDSAVFPVLRDAVSEA